MDQNTNPTTDSDDSTDTTSTDSETDLPTTRQLRGHTSEATLVWVFGEDEDEGDVVPKVRVPNENHREVVFDHFDADSAADVEDAVITGRRPNDRRLGLICNDGGEAVFYPEAALLASVEGVSYDLAAGLIEECGDIPDLCARIRHGGETAVGDLRNDAEAQGCEWLEDLDAFIEDYDAAGETMERRLKDAKVWVEPDDVTGGGL